MQNKLPDEVKMHTLCASIIKYRPYIQSEQDIWREFLYNLGVGRYDEQVLYNFITPKAEDNICLFCKRIGSHTQSGLHPCCIHCQDELNALPNQVKMNHHLAYSHFQWIIHTLGIDIQRRIMYNLCSKVREAQACAK